MANGANITSPTGNMTIDDMYKALGGGANTAMATAGTGRYGVPSDQSMIYLGQQRKRRQAIDISGERAEGFDTTRMMDTYANTRLAPLTWSEETKGKFITQGVMNKVPGFDVNMGMPEIMSAWDDLVQSSYGFNSKDPDNPRWTPQDVLESYSNGAGKFGTIRKGDWEYDVATGEKVKYVGPLTKTTTATTINQLTRGDVLALTKNSMAQLLGRMPTGDEVSKYLGILNGYGEADPQVSTTTVSIDPETGEQRDSTTRTTGGTSAAGQQALIEEQMKLDPEYGAYQAATTGMGWLMAAINGGGR